MTDDPVQRIYLALQQGELLEADLTARRLGAFLGLTSSVIYRKWGSVDVLLHQVSERGLAELGEQFRETLQGDGALPDVAEAYVSFGLDHGVLYGLMFDRTYDWSELPANVDFAGLQMWQAMLAYLTCLQVDHPAYEARLLFATLHGLVSLARSGRANIGEVSTSDRDMAVLLARRAAGRVAA